MRRLYADQLLELRGLRGKSSGKVQLMLQRVQAEATEFEQCTARLQAMRSVHARMMKDVLRELSSDRLRAEVEVLQQVLGGSWLPLGARKAFIELCARLRGLIEQANAEHSERVREADEGDRPGYDALWLSFGLSRAAWVTLPRVMMHDMPDAWQADMARLLDEWESTWVNQPNIGSRVQIVDSEGRLVKTPAWVLNYRHPDLEQLTSMLAAAPSAGSQKEQGE